jgi:hypothetical protein
MIFLFASICWSQGPTLPFGFVPVSSAGLPNLGNTTIEPSHSPGDYYIDQVFTASATGTYVTYHFYCSGDGTTNAVVGVYPAPGNDASGQTLISSVNLACPATAAWLTGTISAHVTSGSPYALLYSGKTATMPYASTSAGTGQYSNISYTYTGTLPSSCPTMIATAFTISEYLSTP